VAPTPALATTATPTFRTITYVATAVKLMTASAQGSRGGLHQIFTIEESQSSQFPGTVITTAEKFSLR
jgi:hypothetical protein